jgi:DNA-binding transcriptional MerR regulator
LPGADQRHLSAAEAAKALGVSTRALRLYEQKGLVRPMRSAAGWRAYGPEALSRLHQILALKRLGLSLAEVGALLQGRFAPLEAVLELQEQALVSRQAETARALELVRRARARLKAGQALSVDDLTTLTRETTMPEPIDEQEMKAIFDPLIEKHVDPETREVLGQREFDQAAIGRAWEQVIAQAKSAMAKGDPATPEAIDIARRWQALVDQFTGGDPKIEAKSRAVWNDAFADPAAAPRLPFGPELMDFIRRAAEAGRAGA